MYNPLNKVEKDLVGLREFCKEIRSRQEKIVLTSGCFDILHGGHLEYLCAAGNLGYLIVGINSDAFVKRLKGEKRPIRNEGDRAFVLAGFTALELFVLFYKYKIKLSRLSLWILRNYIYLKKKKMVGRGFCL